MLNRRSAHHGHFTLTLGSRGGGGVVEASAGGGGLVWRVEGKWMEVWRESGSY